MGEENSIPTDQADDFAMSVGIAAGRAWALEQADYEALICVAALQDAIDAGAEISEQALAEAIQGRRCGWSEVDLVFNGAGLPEPVSSAQIHGFVKGVQEVLEAS